MKNSRERNKKTSQVNEGNEEVKGEADEVIRDKVKRRVHGKAEAWKDEGKKRVCERRETRERREQTRGERELR